MSKMISIHFQILSVIGYRLKTLELNGYVTLGTLTDRAAEHIVRYCLALEQLSLILVSFTSTMASLAQLFSSPQRALQLRSLSLSSFRNVSGRSVRFSVGEKVVVSFRFMNRRFGL